MICLDMNNHDNIMNVAAFVRTYQKNAGMLIGSLEEIAFNSGSLSSEQLLSMAEHVSYGNLLRQISRKSKP